MPSQLEQQFKENLENEINRLIYRKDSNQISMVQKIMSKEMKKRNRQNGGKDAPAGATLHGRDKNGMSSSHHIAAELAIRKMRQFIERRRESRLNNEQET